MNTTLGVEIIKNKILKKKQTKNNVFVLKKRGLNIFISVIVIIGGSLAIRKGTRKYRDQ